MRVEVFHHKRRKKRQSDRKRAVLEQLIYSFNEFFLWRPKIGKIIKLVQF